jgi:rod shape determining protein RodA
MLNYRELDWKLIGAALALSLIGILLIMSAQYHAGSAHQQTFYLRQLMWLVVALVVFAVVIHLPMRLFDIGAYLLYGMSLALLVLVLMFGSARLSDAHRFFTFGSVSLAPSDIAKIALVLALSRFFAYTKLPPTSKRRLALSAILVLIPAMLIFKQPDLGTALVCFVVLLALWFWSGLSLPYLFLTLSPLASLIAAAHWVSWTIYFAVLLVLLGLIRPGVLMSVVAVITNLISGILTPVLWGRLHDYQKLRILTFLDPGQDPRGAGYQVTQSKISIGSGGVFGKGFLEGSQSRLEFLPERHTDFIFSVLGEEFGLIGALIVLILFGFVFYRAVRIAAKCRSRFVSNVAMGAAAILFFQFVINVGMTIGIMPVTGLALPLLSYGGTALVLAWTLVGVIVSADYRWQEY